MRNILLLCFSLLTFAVNAQQWEWGKPFIGGYTSSIKNTATDNFGNVFVLGYLYSATAYESTSISSGFYIAKFHENGTFLWAKNIPSALNGSMDVDTDGNILVLGSYKDSLVFPPFAIYSNGGRDIFLLKINTVGQSIWLKSFGGSLDDIGSAVITDSNNSYITGSITGNVTFSPFLLNDTSTNVQFIGKIDSAGICLWVKKSTYINSKGLDISVGENGNIYTTGILTCTLSSSWSACTNYIHKFSSSGALLLTKAYGTTSTRATNLISKGDQIYILEDNTGYNAGWTNLIKYDTQMNQLWSKMMGNSYSDYWCRDVQIGNGKSIYVWAPFTFNNPGLKDSIQFGSIWIGINHQQDMNVAVARMDSNGIFQNVSPYYVKNGAWGEFSKISLDNNDNCYITCSLFKMDTLIFGFDTINCSQQGFIAKLSNENNSTSIRKYIKLTSIDIFPNPSTGIFTIDLKKITAETKVIVCDLLGNCLLTNNCRKGRNFDLDLSGLPKGIYFLEILSDGNRSVSKVVLQ